jgi:predicted metal-dependent hydrolase
MISRESVMLRLFRRTLPPHCDRIEVRIGCSLCCIAVKRLASARRYTLRVRTAQRDVVLSMPERGSLADAKSFAQKHAGWIETRLRRLAEDVRFAEGALVPLRGVPHLVAHRPYSRGTVTVESGDPPLLAVAGEAPHLDRRLTDWLKRQARNDLSAAVERHCAKLGMRHKGLSIKDTASRWGSCSSTGALSFSWRLVLAPPFVLDYLAAHEVAHLKEMNHSPRFWRICELLCPRTRDAKGWLRAHGAGLHRYGAQREA